MSVLPFVSPVLGHERTTPAVLLEIAQAISSTLDIEELLKIVAQRTATACDADVCSIFLWNQSGDRLVPMMAQIYATMPSLMRSKHDDPQP